MQLQVQAQVQVQLGEAQLVEQVALEEKNITRQHSEQVVLADKVEELIVVLSIMALEAEE